MPPYRDCEKRNLIGDVLGNYKDIQAKYGNALVDESVSKNAKVAALGVEARGIAKAGAQEVLRIRSEGERQVLELQLEAEARVHELEQERLQRLESHHAALRALQESTEAERAATEQRIRDVDEEAQALFAAGEARIRSIGEERDRATRAARDRCTAAEESGEERVRQAFCEESRLQAQSQASVKDSERQCALRVKEVEARGEAWRKHHQGIVQSVQDEVARRVEDMLRQGCCSREDLAENRVRADSHLHIDLARKREATMQQILEKQIAVNDARDQRHAANEMASQSFEALVEGCQNHRGDQIMHVSVTADAIKSAADAITWHERANHERYDQMVKLAEMLRSGNILGAAPPIPLVAPRDIVLESTSS